MDCQAKLNRDFFRRNTCVVAQELLGKVLVFHDQYVLINETEAYHGFDDPASHAYRGKTKRSSVMFGEAGVSYVYLIYGMYHCLNIVTEAENFPAAVLIRGGFLLDQEGQPTLKLNGPGKLCRALGIDLQHNALDIIEHPHFYVEDRGIQLPFKATPRIGIKQGLDKDWRFVAQSFAFMLPQ